MSFRLQWRPCALALSAVIVACGKDAVAPAKQVPTRVEAVSAVTTSGAVGSAVDGGLVVQVSDQFGKPMAHQAVALAVTAGNGSTDPRVAITDANGKATAAWTLGTIIGLNEVTASVTGVTTQVKFQATGTSGPATSISMTPRTTRLLAGVDSTRITVQSLDSFGNQTSPGPAIVVRDPTLITVEPNGVVRVLRRGGSTYVVATSGTMTDSVLVTVLAPGQSLCTGVADPVDLAVGQVVTDVSGAGFCVHATAPNTEYAIIPFFNSGVPSASTQIEVRGQGLAPLSIPNADVMIESMIGRKRIAPPALTPDHGFERRLRDRERSEGKSRIAGARTAMRSRRNVMRTSTALAAVPAIGDVMKLNVNTAAYCTNPDLRTGRVVAVTDKAIVVADTANPEGGFSDAEYHSFGVTFDTLVDPVDRTAFGAPTDIDNNGHIILFFTRAVNELTTSGASGVVLGYFYNRDLIPKFTTQASQCPASNEAEVMFLMVPDTAGVINGNRRSKAQVLAFSDGTAAHEYQHMINAGRRLYVNAVSSFEEGWLDEGLSHIAEDLNFWRASGLTTRSNLDSRIFSDTKLADAYSTFEANNILRYQTYLARPETQAPIGTDPLDTDLQTRGAIWSFLRFAADHLPVGTEDDLWFKLVNSKTSGVANLTAALGSPPNGLLRDWAISVFLDDNAPNVDPRFQQPSWNMRNLLTNAGTSLAYPLLTHVLSDGRASLTQIAGNGVGFFRFSVASDQEALLTVNSGGVPVPSTIQIAVVRLK
jgi:Bacterial Ig-like domain (group 1)./Peptidase M30.